MYEIGMLLRQAAALMAAGMFIVFGMLFALIAVIQVNARLLRRFAPAPTVRPPGPAAPATPVAAIAAAAVHAFEEDRLST